MHLYLIRHADAAPHGDPDFDDDDRPLTETGHAQVRAVAAALQARGIAFEVLLSSPLPRARQTADGLMAAVPELVGRFEEAEELRPGAKFRKFLRRLRPLAAESVAVVGHQPELGQWAARLIGSKKAEIEPAKGSVTCLRCDATPGKGAAVLEWLVTPEWLAAPADDPRPVAEGRSEGAC